MNSLFIGIINFFNANSTGVFYTSVGGRLYLNFAPQESAYPYCIFSKVAPDTEYDFTDELSDTTIQFKIVTQNNSSLQAGTILKNLTDLFDFCQLTVTGWNFLLMKKENDGISNGDYSQVPPIQGYDIDYKVLLERKRIR